MSADRINNYPRQPEKEPSSMTLRNALVDATFTRNRALPGNVKSLQLGDLAPEANDLMNLTLGHPRRVEYGKVLYVTPERKLLVPTQAVEGIEGGKVMLTVKVTPFPGRRGYPREQQQDRFIASLMHTHEELDFPPSPIDMRGLFLKNDHIIAQTAVFVITKSQKPDGSLTSNKYIIFRGEQTPQWSEEEANDKVRIWEQMLVERVKAHIDNKVLSRGEQLAVNARAQGAFMRQLVKKYDLRLFTAVNGSDSAVLATA